MQSNMTRDQFLVESVGGHWHEKTRDCIIENGRVIQSEICSCGYQPLTVLGFHREENNPDFAKRENFWRLLEIADAKNVHYTINQTFICITTATFSEVEGFSSSNNIPKITADLIAKALGWKERE